MAIELFQLPIAKQDLEDQPRGPHTGDPAVVSMCLVLVVHCTLQSIT